jgi:glycosyltransferase involved in cell wall biosynthesis
VRVLIVIMWDGGGVITAMRNVAAQLRQRGVRFSVFSFNGFHAVSRWSDFCDGLYSNQQVSLTELLVREKFDVVNMLEGAVVPPYSTCLWLRRARYTGGIVCMSHNSVHETGTGDFAHVYIACSEASREFMAKFVDQPIRVIANGVDTDEFHPRRVADADRPERPVLAWIGRSTDLKQKDVYGFLQLAAALVDETDPGCDFWIIDADPVNPGLRLKEWFGDRIKYEHELNREQLIARLSQVAASGGAVVSTSEFEGLPYALLEASACGCPVIAPRAPGFEYIRDGQSGLLYGRRSGLAELKRCVARLKDATLRQTLIDGAMADIRSVYNCRTMAQGYHQAYLDAVDMARVSPKGTRSAWDGAQATIYAVALRGRRGMRRLMSPRAVSQT